MNKSFTNAFLWLNRSSLPKMIKFGWVELEKTKALEERKKKKKEDGNTIQPISLFFKKSQLLNQTEFLNALNGIV